MKKGFLMILCVFSFCNIRAQFVFQSEDQRWTVTGVVSNDDYTAIYCDITILNNKGGCFDVHDFDKNTKIYISGEFGEHKLISSQYEGYYKPWYRYTNITNWNYYYPGNKNKVAHATFYFARIPAGVTHIKWSFYGGRGISLFKKRRNYQCPTFVINNLQVQNNKNTTPQTQWTEEKLRSYWKNEPASPIEGIYNFISTSNPRYWGTVRHKIAIVKENELYKIVYLDGANQYIWKEGELKGYFTPTTTRGIYKVATWFLDNKMRSKADFYVEYHNRHIKLYDTKNFVETTFMKLYPEYDIDADNILKQQELPTAVEEPKPIGNGSGFFIGKNIIATNHHVIDGAKKIEIVVQTNESVKTYLAKVLCTDKVNDLALLVVDDQAFTCLNALPYNIYHRTIDVGSSIFTMGYPMAQTMGSEIKITDGIISSRTGYDGQISAYQISAPIQPGNSGGPMFDKTGQLIGITSAGIPGADNVGYAIKSSYLYQLIDASPIDIEDITTNVRTNTEFTSLIKQFSPYVVMVLIY